MNPNGSEACDLLPPFNQQDAEGSWFRRTNDDRRLPYVALVAPCWYDQKDGDLYSVGSGVLVDRRHVLTCSHVLDPEIEGGCLSTKLRQEATLDRFRITVEVGGESVGAEIVAEDKDGDLALLRLDKPIIGVRAPLEPVELGAGVREAWICGYDPADGGHFMFHVVSLDPSHGKRIGAVQQTGHHHFGAEGGASGGPIFTAVQGEPAFVGIARLGGCGSSSGHYIAADRARKFLQHHRIAIETFGPPADAIERWCRVEGYAPVLKSDRPEIVPDHRCLPNPERRGPLFYGLHPISAAVDPARAGTLIAKRLAAHFADPDRIVATIADLSRECGFPLRLPTETEFRHLCNTAAPPRRVLGRPSTLQDYDTDTGLRAPPDTSAEWVDDGGRPHLCLFRDGEVNRFSDVAALAGTFAQVRAVVRTVADLAQGP